MSTLFQSLHYEPRRLEVTEQRLEKIYAAAKKGLKGDSLALASGMMPTEYRQLSQFEPLVELAELKGRADGEMQVAQVIDDAIAQGDAKMALEKAKHQYGWVAKQQISVDIDQKISITAALEMADKRMGAVIIDETLESANSQGLLINNRKEDGDDYTDFNSKQTQRAV